MKNDYSRKLPAARSQETEFIKLTSKQWGVYYWLVSKSYWNGTKREGHYYLYKSSFNYTDIKKDLKISDNRTIQKAIEKLELYNKIAIAGDIIYIPHPDLYSYVSIKILSYLLNICAITNLSNELIVLYSILKRLKELNERNGNKTTFTLKLFVKLLGHSETDRKAYLLVRVFISFLSGEGFINISQTTKRNRGGEYIEYTLWDIKQELDKENIIDFNGEEVVEIQNKVKDLLEQEEN